MDPEHVQIPGLISQVNYKSPNQDGMLELQAANLFKFDSEINQDTGPFKVLLPWERFAVDVGDSH